MSDSAAAAPASPPPPPSDSPLLSGALSVAVRRRPVPGVFTPPAIYGSAAEFAQAARRRRGWFTAAAVALGAVCAAAFAGTGIDSLLVPLVVILIVLMPILIWRLPRMVLFTTYAAVCTIELLPTGASDAITDRIPFFWNVNTIFQVYAHAGNFHAIPFNLFEVFIIIAGLCSLFRAVFQKEVTVKGGPLLRPILLYLFWVLVAWINGKMTGGDFKISLQETRGQFYFLIAYLMAYNMVRDRRAVDQLLWITIIGLIVKGLMYTFRRYVTLHGAPLPDQGVGSHEEAFLFDAYAELLMAIALCGTQPNMRKVALAGLIPVILGNLACNRRASTAAIAIVFPVLIIAAIQGLPHRRKLAFGIIIAVATLGPLYYQAFKFSESAIAQPARAIHSQFQPDERDRLSNLYRDEENADQMATIKANPLGLGYGKHFIHAVPIADISSVYEWWDILPHNQVLWVWMRTGTQGFFCFWMMISSFAIFAGLTFRDSGIDMELRAVALFALLTVGLLIVFGLLDLQLSNFRDLMFTATWVGVLARIPQMRRTGGNDPAPPPPSASKPKWRRQGSGARKAAAA